MTVADAIAGYRLAKARRLADILSMLRCTAYRVSQMQERHWTLAASAAKVRLPSAETRQLVYQLIEARENPHRRKGNA